MPTKSPPEMAKISEKRVKSGSTIINAIILGTAKKTVGENPMIKRASTSSEIFMVPISAAKADPDLPATTIAVMIGPSSETIAIETREATYIFAPNCSS
jgi:hypothetical protein